MSSTTREDLVAVVDSGSVFDVATPIISLAPPAPGCALYGRYYTRAKKAWLVGKFLGMKFDGSNEEATDNLNLELKELWRPRTLECSFIFFLFWFWNTCLVFNLIFFVNKILDRFGFGHHMIEHAIETKSRFQRSPTNTTLH